MYAVYLINSTNARNEQCVTERTSENELEFERHCFINEARQLSKEVSILHEIESILADVSQPIPRLETWRREPEKISVLLLFLLRCSIKMHQG